MSLMGARLLISSPLRSVSSAVCVCRVLSACWALRPTGRPRGLRYGLFSHDSPFRFPSGFSIYTLSRAFSRALCLLRVLIPLPPPLPCLFFRSTKARARARVDRFLGGAAAHSCRKMRAACVTDNALRWRGGSKSKDSSHGPQETGVKSENI